VSTVSTVSTVFCFGVFLDVFWMFFWMFKVRFEKMVKGLFPKSFSDELSGCKGKAMENKETMYVLSENDSL
jgi:hypothetical protein